MSLATAGAFCFTHHARLSTCDSDTRCSYPPSQSTYTSDMLRAINFLVETTDDKRWHCLHTWQQFSMCLLSLAQCCRALV